MICFKVSILTQDKCHKWFGKIPLFICVTLTSFFPFAVNVFIHQSIPSMGVIFHDIPIIHLRVICSIQIHISFPSSNQFLCFTLSHCTCRNGVHCYEQTSISPKNISIRYPLLPQIYIIYLLQQHLKVFSFPRKFKFTCITP